MKVYKIACEICGEPGFPTVRNAGVQWSVGNIAQCSDLWTCLENLKNQQAQSFPEAQREP